MSLQPASNEQDLDAIGADDGRRLHRPARAQNNETLTHEALSRRAGEMLLRSIVLTQPLRLVEPLSWAQHIPFAFWIVDALRPTSIVELGTHAGNSYSALAQAVATLRLPATCYAIDTWKGDAHSGPYGEEVFEEWREFHDRHFRAFSTLVRHAFDQAASMFSEGSIDLLHIDGWHTYEAVRHDFETWLPKLSARSVVLLHDISVREGDFGVWRLWEELQGRFPSLSFVHGHGLGVLGVGRELPPDVHTLLTEIRADNEWLARTRQFFVTLGEGIERRGVIECGERNSEDLQRAYARLQKEYVDLGQHIGDLERGIARATGELKELRSLRECLRTTLLALQTIRESRLWRWSSPVLRRLNHVRRRPGDRTSDSRIQALISSPRLPPFLERDAEVISESGLFDEVFYLTRYPAAILSGMPAIEHYLVEGANAGYSPCLLFDSSYYTLRNPDLRAAGTNPLLHYVRQGVRELRDPHPLFSTRFYLSRNPAVAKAGVNPLVHFLERGGIEGRSPHPLFDAPAYLASNPDVAASRSNPLVHFLQHGAGEGRRPHTLFDTRFYLETYPDVMVDVVNPLVHYVTVGWREGRDPSPAFSTREYLSAHPELKNGDECPLAHHVRTQMAQPS